MMEPSVMITTDTDSRAAGRENYRPKGAPEFKGI